MIAERGGGEGFKEATADDKEYAGSNVVVRQHLIFGLAVLAIAMVDAVRTVAIAQAAQLLNPISSC